MIPNQRRWERSGDSKALLPPSRLGNFPGDSLRKPQSNLLSDHVRNRLADLADTAARHVCDFAERIPNYSAPLVVAIDTGAETGTGAEELCNVAAARNWMQLKVSSHRITRKDLIALAERITVRAKSQGVATSQIYLFATGLGAEIALQLLALKPSNFSGIGILDGCCQHPDKSLALIQSLKHRAYLTASTRGSQIRQMLGLCRLLNSVGMQVTTKLCATPSADGRVSVARVQDFIKWTRRDNS